MVSARALTVVPLPVQTLNTGALVLAAAIARVSADGIADIDKVAHLLAIAKDIDRLAAHQLVGEKRDNTGVWRAGILPRTVEIEEAQSDRRDTMHPTGDACVKLAGALVSGVGAQRRSRVLL